MELKRAKKQYDKSNRADANIVGDTIYLFEDNLDRKDYTYSSYKIHIDNDSEYALRFGKTDLWTSRYINESIIRGCKMAYPITTKKGGNCVDVWLNSDFDAFKAAIDDDIKTIKRAVKEKGIKKIIFPKDGFISTAYSEITIDRTPKLFRYILQKEIELSKL